MLFCGRGLECFSPIRGTNSKTIHLIPLSSLFSSIPEKVPEKVPEKLLLRTF